PRDVVGTPEHRSPLLSPVPDIGTRFHYLERPDEVWNQSVDRSIPSLLSSPRGRSEDPSGCATARGAHAASTRTPDQDPATRDRTDRTRHGGPAGRHPRPATRGMWRAARHRTPAGPGDRSNRDPRPAETDPGTTAPTREP